MQVDPASVRQRAQELIDASDAELPRDLLKRELRVATQFRTARATEANAPVGVSRMGGRPDLPPSLEWPRWEGFRDPDRVLRGDQLAAHKRVLAVCKQPVPDVDEIRIPQGCQPSTLMFLAQLDLATIPDGTGLLPERGWLYFFYDAEQQPWGFDPRARGSARVFYFDGDVSALSRSDAPEGTKAFEPTSLKTELVVTLPRWTHSLGIELEERASEAYRAIAEKHLSGSEPHHRLLGWPKQVQGEMGLECQLVTNGLYCGSPDGYKSARAKLLQSGAKDWMLLLQLDTDQDGPGWMWGDAGCLYFWIRKQDLAERRFDRTWTILQCY